MAKIQITQKEYDKLKAAAEELIVLKKQLKECHATISENEKSFNGLDAELKAKENEISKCKKLLEVTENNLSEIDAELSETKETISQLSKKMVEVNKENATLTETKTAYDKMRQSWNTFLAHTK